MKKRLLQTLALASLLVAGAAVATTGYWTRPATCGPYPCVKSAYAGTGAAPNNLQPDGGVISNNWDPDAGVNSKIPGLDSMSGLSLAGLKGFAVTVELNGASPLDAGGTFTATTLVAYVYSPAAARWSRAPDLDLTVAAGLTAQSFFGFTVTSDMGRVAFVPGAIGQPTNVYISGTR
jgi:hypothetical protein